MTGPKAPARGWGAETDRRSLLVIGWLTAVLAGLHLVDHALRGARVTRRHLPAAWNHSGWPFTDQVTPYTASLVAVTVILAVGLVGTYRGRLWAGYWLGAAVILETVVVVVHLLPTEHQESPHVIHASWHGRPVIGATSLGITFAIVAVLVLMAVNAIRVRRSSGRWT